MSLGFLDPNHSFLSSVWVNVGDTMEDNYVDLVDNNSLLGMPAYH